MREIGLCAVLASAFAATGCATVINGTRQNVEIRTTPPGARALILPEGETIETPADVELRRKLAHTVRFELDGYCPETAFLDRVFSSAIYGNLLIGGLLGFSVDTATGGAFQLTPDPMYLRLRAASTDSDHGECPPTTPD